MSGEGLRPRARRRRRRQPDRPRTSTLVSGAAYVVVMAVIAIWAAWPIYQSWVLLLPTVGGVILGAGIAALGVIRKLPWYWLLAGVVGVYLVLGVPLTMPGLLSTPSALPAGWLDLASATVLSWKQLVTIALPVGEYQSLLVPPFLLFLAGSAAALSLLWRSRRFDVLAVPIMLLVQLFGLAFGLGVTSAETVIAGVNIPAPRETAIGLFGFLASILFLSLRAQLRRRSALRTAAVAGGVRATSDTWGPRIRRVGVGILVLAVAVGIALPVLGSPARAEQRDVLRSAIDPEQQLRAYVSPLSQYRASFEGAAYDAETLRVTAVGKSPDRLRLAVMSYYDGEVYRVVDPDASSDESSAYARSAGAGPAPENALRLGVTVGAYNEVWMPLAGTDPRVNFSGQRAAALTDGYFFNAGTDSGVELAQLKSGDSYSLQTSPRTETPLASLAKPSGGGDLSKDLVPKSLTAWVDAQKLGTGASDLAELIRRLRARGYLSHALTAPTAEKSWESDLGDYSFEPSLAGHSIDRIDQIFTALLQKQGTSTTTDDSALVAAPGDDEQFSVAAALLAEHLGFNARIVLGYSLTAPADDSDTTVCDDGVCHGKDLAAWVEIGGSNGKWATVDVTPQHENAIEPINDRKRDPEIASDTSVSNATEKAPPEAAPSGGDSQKPSDDEDGLDLTWLWNLLRVVGISLLVIAILLAPFLVIIAAKVSRRKSRRQVADATASIAGGWDDYVDTAIDLGLRRPGAMTRVELAAEYNSPNGHGLATIADAAVFGVVPPAAEQSEEYWNLVDDEREALGSEFTRWQRIRAAISVRSFARFLGARRRRPRE